MSLQIAESVCNDNPAAAGNTHLAAALLAFSSRTI